MKAIVLDAFAKVNLTLNIEGKRSDGYHLLSSVFQSISLADRIVLEKADDRTLWLSDPTLVCDERNTALRAANAFFKATGIPGGVHIRIEKHIPQQAGLGGGSADAAGVLVGLNVLYGADLSQKALCTIGETIGADVPFCIVGGTAMVRGIGEIVEPLAELPPCFLVLAKPPVGVSTAAAYAAVDAVKTVPSDQQALCRAIEKGDLKAVGAQLGNAFLQALALFEADALVERMRAFSPLGVTMSGSGSTVFALFEKREQAEACAHSLADIAQAIVCTPCQNGTMIIRKD
ncbi:MAG: 4-(cytidine 5'-diphospho)-2-C-methyl-D-erythritol kinase [Acutalibacteraceae bacterium]